MDPNKKSLLKVVLSKPQTRESIRKNLLEGHEYLQEHHNVDIVVDIRGFEKDCRHPALIKDAKKCYALAFEEGLAGLIIESGGRNNLVCEVYSMAYLKGKVKMTGGKRVVKFQRADEDEFNAKTFESCDTYLKLVELNSKKK